MNQQILCRQWNRSYKEDTETQMVFRRDDFDFPPPTDRFGRASINLEADNSFSQRGNILRKEGNLAANDGFNNTGGKWQLEDETIALFTDADKAALQLKIISLDENKLVVEKQ